MRVLQPLIAFAGNAPPQLALTRKLLERGHQVRVLGHRAARERIEATGAEFVAFERALPAMDLSRRETDTLRDWEARTWLGASLRTVANGLFAFVGEVSLDCSERLREWPADVVAFDWMLTGAAVAAERAGLPAAAIVHCPYPLPVDGAPPLFSGLRPRPGRLGELRDRALGAGARRFLDLRGLPLLNRARAAQGLAPLGSWEEQLTGAAAICVMTAPELDFSSRAALPPNVRYVGPAFEPYASQWSPSWSAAGGDPLVLVSLSTSYMDQSRLAQRILDALGGLPVRALLTAGPALETTALRPPSNARIVDYLDHRSVLPHAALMISHAGWQTINAALADGVPLLCLPGGRDQPDNAARVVFAGAGARISRHASRARLRSAISGTLADPRLRQGAEAMSIALARSDGALAVAELLEGLAADTSAAADRR